MERFNEIFNTFHPQVKAFLNKRVNDTALVEDIASETMLKLFNNLNKFDGNIGTMKTWVFSIAKNAVIDHWRKKSIETTSISAFIDDDGNEFLPIACSSDPTRDLISNDLGIGIRYAINELPEQYREIAKLFFLDEMSYKEITLELSIPLGTVKGSIFRVREMLQNKLEYFKLA